MLYCIFIMQIFKYEKGRRWPKPCSFFPSDEFVYLITKMLFCIFIMRIYFEGMVNQIYPPELQLNKANTSYTEALFLDLHLSISNGFVSSKIYDKRDEFDFDIVNFPFLDGDVTCRPSYGVYIFQLIRFARVCSHVDDFNTRNKC